MQPLYSVDHESRQNSYRADEEHLERAAEDTPLLHRFPENSVPEHNPYTTVVVSLLLIILLSGVIIGIYLLVLQSNAENILPPVEMPLQLVSHSQWDQYVSSHPVLSISPFMAKHVIVIQTDTEQCDSSRACIRLLRDMQTKTNTKGESLPYNFLVSSNGQTYENLGWHRPSQLFPEMQGPSLVLAFIGNFTTVQPTNIQVEESKIFFAESVSQQHLDPSFTVIGKRTKYTPTYLFNALKTLPQWDSMLSDM